MIGERLKELRMKKNLTQKQLADQLKLSQSTIGMIESGKRAASNELLIKFADYFQCSTDYLLGKTDFNESLKKIEKSNKSLNDDDFTQEELELLEEIKNDPEISILFHDLKSAPKKKIKQLLSIWDVISQKFDEMDEEDE